VKSEEAHGEGVLTDDDSNFFSPYRMVAVFEVVSKMAGLFWKPSTPQVCVSNRLTKNNLCSG